MDNSVTTDLALIRFLEANEGNLVRIRCRDGAVIVAKPIFVSAANRDVIVDLVSSSRMLGYRVSDPSAAYQFTFDDIESVEAVSKGEP